MEKEPGAVPPQLAKYAFKAGDPAPPGAGRPKGSENKNKLPPIHIGKLPFPITQIKKGMSAADYWDIQAPKTLIYMFKRLDAHFVYAENGVHDALGAALLKIMGKELIKDIRTQAKQQRAHALADAKPNEGKSVKKFRQELVKMKETYADDAEVIDNIPAENVEFQVLDDAEPGVGAIEDEF